MKFQRTRGVLRLMASVIHSLWEKGDRNPLILPSTIPIDDPRVQTELTRYLSDNWAPIIEKDVDGPASLPWKIDGDVSNLGKLHASRRVARTIYLGSAPTAAAAHRGLEDRRVKLGCVMPGESPPVCGDALRRLAAAATYLYQDGPRFWYSTQPTVTKLAEDRAEQLKRDPDNVAADGVALLTWQSETFAYAEGYDEAADRYLGLRSGQLSHLSPESSGVLVKPDVAGRQLDAELVTPAGPGPIQPGRGGEVSDGGVVTPPKREGEPAAQPLPCRFHGTVELDPTRVGRDAGRIAEEVIAHLSALVGADVRVTLDIAADIPAGAPDHVVRTVTENSRTLKFTNQEFESE